MLIGWSEKSITPDRKIGLDGQFYERVSNVVETPITCTAWAVEADGEQLVICSGDLLGVGELLMDRVRELLREEPAEGLDPERVIMNATHTHASFAYNIDNRIADFSSLDVLKKYIPADRKYVSLLPPDADEAMGKDEALEFIAVRMAACIREAWNTRAPGSFSTGFGRAAVGMNRRVCFEDGTAKMWGDTNAANFEALEGGNDSGIEMIFTYDPAGKLTGIVANIACPSQVMEHRSVISSDYWGKVRIMMREKYGEDLKILGLCSAAGDLCPRDLIRWVEPETPICDPNIRRVNVPERDADPSMFDVRGTWVCARRIVSEMNFAIEEAPAPKSDARLIHQVDRLELPLRRVTEEEKTQSEEVLHSYIEKKCDEFSFEDSAEMHVYAGNIARFEFQKQIRVIPVEIHTVRLGNIAFATNPFELFLDYGNKIRAHSKARQTFLIQLANGYYGYLPTEKAEKGGHYSAYVSSGFAGHDAGEQLVKFSLDRINGMFDQK